MDIKEFVQQRRDAFIAMRRDFHMYPEPAWLEYRSASKVADKLISLGYDVALGSEVLDLNSRMGLPSDEVMKAAMERAIDEGGDPELVEKMGYGKTAIVATMKFSDDGPVVAFRADMDSNDVIESKASNHTPAKNGFRSRHEKAMHACGHDAHMSTGLALAHWVADHKDELKGRIKFLFQPAEEGVRGAAAMAASGIVDDADFFLGAHIAMMCKSGEISVNPYGFLCTTKMDVTYTGRPAHAGVEPNAGRNAMAAACNAFVQLLGIARHGSGMTRINVGQLNAGEGRNVIPSHAVMKMEVRGETGEINQYMYDSAVQIIKGCALSQGCEYTIEKMGEAVDLTNDQALVDVLTQAGNAVEGMNVRKDPMNFGGSEDATILARRVQAHGGKAAFFVLGADRPSGHHTARFDIDEKALDKGLAVWANAVSILLKK